MSPHLRYEIIATLFITFPDKDRKISAKARVLLIRRFGKQRLAQLSELPIVKPVLEWAYPLFVRHRHRVPVWLLGKNARLHCAQGYCRSDLSEKLQHLRSLKH